MEIIKGKYSGFCAGVDYTYKKAKDLLKEGLLYCLGEIIHNDQVNKELKDLGMVTVEDVTKIPDNSRTMFRAHGEGPDSYEYCKEHNIDVIDLTCANVKLIHNKVLDHLQYYILLIGKKNHPEVLGTSKYCNKYSIIESIDDIKDSYDNFIKSNLNKVYVISQTTFSSKLFNDFVDNIKSTFKSAEIIIDNTICNATEKRQEEVRELSNKCNKMLVIGSKNSSNTKELYNIASSICKDTYFVESEEDIRTMSFKGEDIIGVVGGASVPNYLIDNVIALIK